MKTAAQEKETEGHGQGAVRVSVFFVVSLRIPGGRRRHVFATQPKRLQVKSPLLVNEPG